MTIQEMQWKKLLSSNRFGATQQVAIHTNGRTPFESDVDRILFSAAFRRLAKKTQVHPLASNDHVHNRLTHSVEVARVGNALGNAVGSWMRSEKRGELPENILPTDIGCIVHAASLAHDIGNPPFGHQGENAIRDWFNSDGAQLIDGIGLGSDYKMDIAHFEGNAQGFRILSQLENHIFSGGLQLTYATLATFLKYPRLRGNRSNDKNSAYISESSILDDVAESTGLLRKGDEWSRHPLVYLVEAADDICYGILDLEDGVELGLLSFDQVLNVLTKDLGSDEKSKIKKSLVNRKAFRVNLSRVRGALFDQLVEAALDGFRIGYDDIMLGNQKDSLFDFLPADNPYRNIVKSAKRMAKDKIFGDPKKVEIELGSSSTFATLLSVFVNAAIQCARYKSDPHKKPINWKGDLVLKLLGDHSPLEAKPPPGSKWDEYHCIRRAIDFVSGMTDNYATYIAHQIQGAGFSGVQRP